jgi:hypothetical protein
MNGDASKSRVAETLAIAGTLPIAAAATGLPEGLYLAFALFAASVALQAMTVLIKSVASKDGTRLALILLGGAILGIIRLALGFADRVHGPGIGRAIDMVLFCGLMRAQETAWRDDISRGIGFNGMRLAPLLGACAFLIVSGFLREALGRGGISFPSFGPDPVGIAIPGLAGLAPSFISSPGGFLILAGFAAALIRVAGRGRRTGAA